MKLAIVRSFLICMATLMLPVWALPAGAGRPQAEAADREQAGRRLLGEGVDGLSGVLDEAGAPPLTFNPS